MENEPKSPRQEKENPVEKEIQARIRSAFYDVLKIIPSEDRDDLKRQLQSLIEFEKKSLQQTKEDLDSGKYEILTWDGGAQREKEIRNLELALDSLDGIEFTGKGAE